MIGTLTATQRDNLIEWLNRCKESNGLTWSQGITLFNSATVEFQQSVIRKRWYRASDGQAINRALLPVGAA